MPAVTTTFAAALAAALLLLPDAASGQNKKPGAQEQRVKACAAQANRKSLQGRKRQEFMSACLKQRAKK